MQRSYKSFDEFAREELRPLTRVGFSIDDLEIDNNHYQEDFLFDDAGDDDDE